MKDCRDTYQKDEKSRDGHDPVSDTLHIDSMMAYFKAAQMG